MDMDFTERKFPDYERRRGLAGHQPKNETDRKRGYTESTFGNNPVFKCCFCPFDNFKEADTRIHVFQKHWLDSSKPFVPVAMRPPEATLYQANGDLVTEIQSSVPGSGEPHEGPVVDPDSMMEDVLADLHREGVL